MAKDADMLKRLKIRIPEETNNLILYDILESAKNVILAKRFPFEDNYPEEVEPRYRELQLQIAIRMYNKMGAEGEIAHNEGGVNRRYGSASEYEDLLVSVVPKGAVR